MKKTDKQKTQSKIVQHFMESIPAQPPRSELLDPMDVACVLGVDESEAREMIDAGAFGEPTFEPGSRPGPGSKWFVMPVRKIARGSLLRFLEQHGARWFTVRTTKAIAVLRSDEAMARRRVPKRRATDLGLRSTEADQQRTCAAA